MKVSELLSSETFAASNRHGIGNWEIHSPRKEERLSSSRVDWRGICFLSEKCFESWSGLVQKSTIRIFLNLFLDRTALGLSSASRTIRIQVSIAEEYFSSAIEFWVEMDSTSRAKKLKPEVSFTRYKLLQQWKFTHYVNSSTSRRQEPRFVGGSETNEPKNLERES